MYSAAIKASAIGTPNATAVFLTVSMLGLPVFPLSHPVTLDL